MWVRGELIAKSELASWRADRMSFLGRLPSDESPAGRLGILDQPKHILDEKGAIPKNVEDDESDARTVVADSAAHAWKDWPHQGPASLLHRHGGDPRSWFPLSSNNC